MSKKRIIIIVIIIVALLGLIALAIVFSGKTKKTTTPSTTTTPAAILNTNQDTGEKTISDPSLGTSESQDSTALVVYGMADLIDASNIYQTQIDYIKAQLSDYNVQNLNSKYTNMTIRPQDLTVDFTDDVATSTLRLGDTDTLVNLRIVGISSGNMQIFITDSTGKNGGNFTSPVGYEYND